MILQKENNYLKKQVDVLKKENEAMKIKLIKKDLADMENTVTQPEDKGNLETTKKYNVKNAA